jgi:hypothetical protein
MARIRLDFFADQSIAWCQTPGGEAALLRSVSFAMLTCEASCRVAAVPDVIEPIPGHYHFVAECGEERDMAAVAAVPDDRFPQKQRFTVEELTEYRDALLGSACGAGLLWHHFGQRLHILSGWAKPICDKRKSLRSRTHEFGELVVEQGCF